MIRSFVSAAVRRRSTVFATQRRHMAGGGGPKKEWTGIDKVLRSYFPEDEHMALFVMGMYGTMFIVYKLSSKAPAPAPEKKVEAAPAPAAPATTGIPGVESPEFDNFLNSDNFTKLLENEDQLNKLVANL